MDTIPKIKHQVLLSKWAGLIQDCQMSGMTVQNWCTNNDINVKTYYYWLKKVRERTLMAAPETGIRAPVSAHQTNLVQPACESKVSFKPLEVHVPMPNMQAAVIVRLPNATLEVTNDASQRTLEAVLLALKSVC